MWDLHTLARVNSLGYCEWLSKRIAESLQTCGVAVSDNVKLRIEEFVRQLPEQKEPPSIY